jgi:hypothetical protein
MIDNKVALFVFACIMTCINITAFAAKSAEGNIKKWYLEGNLGYVLLNPVDLDYSCSREPS